MSKTWETKKKILNTLSKGVKTPGEISQELELAPSTVSEHMEELERIGAITRVENQFVRKWKYYKANPNFNMQNNAVPRATSKIPQIATALVIALGIIAALIYGLPALSASKGTSSLVSFQLTDPPTVPNGTQALNISYSSIQAYAVEPGNQSEWISGSGSGTLDLMSLINVSQVIGTGSIPANSTITMVKFEINSATIVINGTVYNVTVPDGQLTTPVTGSGEATTNSSILIDLSPVVVSIVTNTSTEFILAPSVKAVYLGSTELGTHIGARGALRKQDQYKLNRAAANISIESAALSVSGNTTTLSVTVKNNGNETVDIQHVTLLGGIPDVTLDDNWSGNLSSNGLLKLHIEAMPAFLQSNSSIAGVGGFPGGFPGIGSGQAYGQGNLSIGASGAIQGFGSGRGRGGFGGQESGPFGLINGVHVKALGNVTWSNQTWNNETWTNGEGNLTPFVPQNIRTLVGIGANIKSFGMLNFEAESNGTLILPSPSMGCNFMPTGQGQQKGIVNMPCIGAGLPGSEGGGYNLTAGASVTLTYTGNITFANQHLVIVPKVGSKWNVVVQDEDGARVSSNVTVT